jgi:acetate kinase
MAILAVNAGSSSLKFSMHPLQQGAVQPSVLSGNIEGLEPGGSPVMGWNYQGHAQQQALTRPAVGSGGGPFALALQSLRQLLATLPKLPGIEAVAHRVVHGGQTFCASVVVTAEILEQLSALNSLAPLHQAHNVAGIRAFLAAYPELPQVACFDTAYHATLAEVDYAFALPRELSAQGVRRYGFHGLSYQFIMGQLLALTPRGRGRVLMAHLGNGASLCAATEGLSRATSMGFSALDGLMMGTRSGTLDPGVLLYLLEQGWDHNSLQTMLYKKSGLLGVSGISADLRRLRQDGSVGAQKAIALFTHRVVRESGALTACIGGLDVMAFSGGIGEHDAATREAVCLALGYLGVLVDPALNALAKGDRAMAIHAASSRVEVWVIPTDEGRVAASEAARLIAS